MTQRYSTVWFGLAACTAMATAMAAPAMGAPEHLRNEEACVAALMTAKGHEQDGRLLEAKPLLASCSMAPCSTFVRQQCAIHHTKLESDIPTVVVLVTGTGGAPRTDVQVRVDGTVLSSHLEGRAVAIDPGMHDFSFIADGRVFATQKVLIVQGQRNRFITATVGGAIDADESHGPPADYHPSAAAKNEAKAEAKNEARADEAPPAPRRAHPSVAAAGAVPAATDTSTGAAGASADTTPAEPAPARKHTLMPWVLSGVGVASLGAGALLTYWGRKDNDLLAQCAPACGSSGLDHIRRLYRDADIAFGVGIAAFAAAYWVYAVGHSGAGETPTGDTALRFEVAPARAGGFASVSGAF